MSQQDNDKELEEYLQGNSELSRRYRDEKGSEPPAHLDKHILEAAREAITPVSKQRWYVPVSIAAVLVIGVSLVLNIYKEQGQPLLKAPESKLEMGARDIAKAKQTLENQRQESKPSAPVEAELSRTEADSIGRNLTEGKMVDEIHPAKKQMIWEKAKESVDFNKQDLRDKDDRGLATLDAATGSMEETEEAVEAQARFESRSKEQVLSEAPSLAYEYATPLASPLQGDEWIVEDIGGKGIIDHSRASIRFGDDGKVSGHATCNRYQATYEVSGKSLVISNIVSTRMACPDALMDQESNFLELLQAAVSYEFSEDGALVIKTKEGRTLLARR